MGLWIVDLLLVLVAVLLMGIAAYQLLFPDDTAIEQGQRQLPKPAFERREAECRDRRRSQALPPGGFERRVAQRR